MTALLQVGFLGVEEGADPKALPPGTLLRADNCAMDKARRLCKRAGTTPLNKTVLGATGIASGGRFTVRGDDTSITDGQIAYRYVSQLATWQGIDRPPCWRATKRTLVDSGRSVVAVDCAISGDMLVTLVETSGGGIFVQVTSLATGGHLLVPQRLATASCKNPRVLINGSTAVLLYSAAGSIEYQFLSLTTLAFGASASAVTDARTAPTVFDAVIATPAATGIPTVYVAYELQAGASRLNLVSFTASTMVAIATLASTGTTDRSIAIAFCTTSQRVAVAYSTDASIQTYITSVNSALAGGTQLGPTSVYAGYSDYVFIAEDDATNMLVGWCRNDGSSTDADRLTTALYSQAANVQVASSERITFGVYYVSRPWRTSSRWYTSAITWVHPYNVTVTDHIAQPSSVVLEIETADSLSGVQDATHPHVATLENYTGWYGAAFCPVNPVADSSGVIWLPAAYRDREPANYTTGIPIGWSLFRLEAQGGDTFRSTALGASSLLAGAAPAWNDGSSTMPYGFAHAPQIISITDTGVGSMAAGTYSYVATYAWRDANGVLHRSVPSPPLSGIAGANRALTVKVATSSVSAKQRTQSATQAGDPVFIELWRTIVGGTGSHYRLSLEPSYQVLLNDPRAGDVSLTDTKADANIAVGNPVVTLASQAQLYTDAGDLENVPPPSFITCTTHRGRLVGIGPDLRTVWPSKDSRIDATLAPGFNEALTIAFATDKTALASLDDKLVVYGEESIDVVYGDGPDDAGAGAWDVRAVQTDVGCVNPRSVAVCPMGSVFESTRGIELLGRDLNVTWVGQVIEDTLATYPTITSAVLVAEEQEVRFTCDNGTNGIVLAWDYGYKIWFVRRYTDAAGAGFPNTRFVDAAMIDGVYTLLTAGGQVYRETSSHKLDGDATYVERDILLAPISAQPGRSGWSNDNLAWQRVKDVTLMGTSVTNHDLEVSFALDYSTTFSDVRTYRAGSDATKIGVLEKCRSTLAVQKCQAVQIRIRDLTPTAYAVSTGDGPIIEALAIRVGAKSGPAKVGVGQEA